MEQLEKRFYNLDELSEITTVNRKANNFKRDVENALAKWGYGYEWINHRGATITHIPTAPEERLREILVRQFHVDIKVDMYSFACFVTAFSDIPSFDSMPWKEREHYFREYLGRQVDERTLRSWAKKLIEQEIVVKGTSGSYWKTEIIDNYKIRSTVSKEEVDAYNKRRTELLDELPIDELALAIMKKDKELTYKQAICSAWDYIYSRLWDEFQCCYYSCKTFHFTAWNKQGDLAEVYELTREISGKEERNA